ncbi:MAG: antibiotic biosynthesis monooxygenase [Pelagibacterales bacterium]|nr:antibiotic biosynthesis monooxygenase [Alphaproteobacteria bacterium]MBL6862197.1 antibiotic biosynthesis monooxygenase [Pelagibacterales bacterium]
MGIVVTAKFFPQSDKVSEMNDWFKNNLSETEKYQGCQLIRGSYNEENKEVLLYEVWDSQEAHQKYVNWRIEIGDIPKLVEMSTKEPEIVYHNEVY